MLLILSAGVTPTWMVSETNSLIMAAGFGRRRREWGWDEVLPDLQIFWVGCLRVLKRGGGWCLRPPNPRDELTQV